MKITTIGEILIDMTQTHIENGIPHFAANPGGAPAICGERFPAFP